MKYPSVLPLHPSQASLLSKRKHVDFSLTFSHIDPPRVRNPRSRLSARTKGQFPLQTTAHSSAALGCSLLAVDVPYDAPSWHDATLASLCASALSAQLHPLIDPASKDLHITGALPWIDTSSNCMQTLTMRLWLHAAIGRSRGP